MTSADHELYAMEESLSALARPVSDDWMAKANADSAAALRDMVHEARMRDRRGVIARFHDGAVAGHTAPAHLILRAGFDFNDAVVAVAHNLNDGSSAPVDDAARDKFGLLMRPLVPGSIEMDFVCQDPTTTEDGDRPDESDGQTMPAEFDNLKTTSASALEIVLGVLRASGVDDREEFVARTHGLTPRAWGKLTKLASRCVAADFTIDFAMRTGEQERFSFSPTNAAALQTFIKLRELTSDPVSYSGTWLTASKVRSVFDLMLDDGTRITGKVPAQLLAASVGLIDQRVDVVVNEESADGDDRVKRTLVSIQASTDDDAGQTTVD